MGKAIAIALGVANHRVVVVGRSTRKHRGSVVGATVEDVAEQVESVGGQAVAVAGDISDSECVVRIRSTTLERFGRIDGIVNAASTTPHGPFFDVAPSRWMQGFSVNVVAPVLLAQAFLPEMVRQGAGRVLSMSSAGMTQERRHRLTHEVTRAGLDRLILGLDEEFGDQGIAVNAIRIDEPLIPADARTLHDPDLPAPSDQSVSEIELAQSVVWILQQPLEFRGQILHLNDLRRLGALPK